MTVAADPFVTARCDIYARFGLDAAMAPWDLDCLLMAVARDTLHRLFPAMVEVEARIAAAPAAEEWQLLSDLFDVCPLGLRIEPVSGIRGIELHVEAGSVSRHDQMLLLDALDQTFAAIAADQSSWPKPALAQFSYIL
ncbi:MAG: hypothetical protein J0H82_16920 [Alphaproteobacteria bacterium]|jgi:hypothetical protein|nr:hypothetical protein [Alphaproteobacteria bacterium]